MKEANKNRISILEISKYRIKLLYRLIVDTPKYLWIIVLSLAAGFSSFFGIPLLIPILDYMKTGDYQGGQNIVLIWAERVMSSIGLTPGFSSMLIIAVAFVLLGELLVVANGYLALRACYGLIRDYSKRLFDGYLRVNWLWLTGTHSGEMNYVVLREVQYAADCHSHAVRLVISFVQCVAYFLVALLLSVKSVLLALLAFSFLTIFNVKNAQHIKKLTQQINENSTNLSKKLSNIQLNKKFLKSSILGQKIVEPVYEDIDLINKDFNTAGLMMQFQRAWNYSFMFIFLVCLILFNKTLGLMYSELMVLVLVIARLNPQLTNLAQSYSQINNCLPMHRSVERRLEMMKDHKEGSGGKPFDGDKAITFNNVGFTYPEGYEALKNISLEISAKHSIGFVGGSGAGKTTILDLLLGLITPSEGDIYYGGVHHSELDLSSLRESIVYINQNPTLFDGTLRENLKIGAPLATDDELKSACKKAHLDKFINEFPEGLDTVIGENGIKISGGQKQRVVLARALMMNPKILVLDEATSELDSESEKIIQQTIQELNKELTIILVAHRLSTVKFTDTIYVLENGAIVESGNYDDLLKKEGRLFQLHHLQK